MPTTSMTSPWHTDPLLASPREADTHDPVGLGPQRNGPAAGLYQEPRPKSVHGTRC